MATVNGERRPAERNFASACWDAASWASATRNAYKKIPYIYPAAGIMPRLAGALRQAGRDGRAGGGPLRLRGVLHRLEASWSPTRGSTCSTIAAPIRSIPSRASPPCSTAST